VSGILGELLKNLTGNIPGFNLQGKPIVEGNDIVLKITEQELAEIAFRGVNPSVRQFITLKCREGYVEIRIRL